MLATIAVSIVSYGLMPPLHRLRRRPLTSRLENLPWREWHDEPVVPRGDGRVGGPLLETKLHVPRPRGGVVSRPRLSERLDRAAHAKLTLVSAPAGFGKTTVLSEWLAGASEQALPAAWLSLDERDNDPSGFWTYVIAALQTVAAGVGETALSLLESPGAATEAVLATLINDLDALPHEVMLVLDDFHLIEDRGVREGVEFLIDHLPAQVHVVIASRADPTLPLAGGRAARVGWACVLAFHVLLLAFGWGVWAYAVPAMVLLSMLAWLDVRPRRRATRTR